ncbi:hypothetical protein Ae201684P_019770 [Aphanomyces euteiches]|nr:hypothetical protein Ae201684P_019770 [Aphanomyces euteiches]
MVISLVGPTVDFVNSSDDASSGGHHPQDQEVKDFDPPHAKDTWHLTYLTSADNKATTSMASMVLTGMSIVRLVYVVYNYATRPPQAEETPEERELVRQIAEVEQRIGELTIELKERTKKVQALEHKCAIHSNATVNTSIDAAMLKGPTSRCSPRAAKRALKNHIRSNEHCQQG